MEASNPTRPWHCLTREETAAALATDPTRGLSSGEVAARLQRHGYNELTEKPGTPAWVLFLHQFKSPLIYVLLVAAVVAALLGEFKDAGVIFGVLMVNAIIGFIQEGRAERSMAALKKLSAPKSHVRRDGKLMSIPSRELVPGDVLMLSAGDRIAADARLMEAVALIVLEGALTGESTGVTKRLDPLPQDTPLADRKNMVFAGTVIAAGRGEALVVSTGMDSELGRIAQMVQEAEEPLTPLQVRLKGFSKLIIMVVLSVMALVFALGLLRGLPLRDIFMVALSQAVSAIPEGLPVAVTVALAVGMQRMAKRRAIIRKLAAVETLGSATVICSDKTGTLTRNEMSVTRVVLPDHTVTVTGIGYEPRGVFLRDGDREVKVSADTDLHRILQVGALCNDAALMEPSGAEGWCVEGDPTEGALVVAAAKAGLDVEAMRREQRRVWEIPFDPMYRMMATGYGTIATAHREPGLANRVWVCVKGAPEEVMKLCRTMRSGGREKPFAESDRQRFVEAQKQLAGDGLRVLAFAEGEVATDQLAEHYEFLDGRMTFLGLMGQIDPPRDEVRDAVGLCKQAGVRTVMVTGDHLLTGKSIARDLGIAGADSIAMEGAELHKLSEAALDQRLERVAVFGRVAPEHKLRIVDGFQRQGHVVAMTGDGVNDAPALTKADIGVAMGITGTEVAKEASAMVITDDNFATIVSAIEQGRIIFNNIRKAVYYLFSTSAAEILALMSALIAGLPLPLRAVQILWVNLVTDGALTVNLVMEKAEGDEMGRAPLRRNAPLVPRRMLQRMFLLVPVMAFGTIGLFAWELAVGIGMSGINFFKPSFWLALAQAARDGIDEAVYAKAQTMTFTVLCAYQWFNGLNARSYSRSIFQLGLFSNPFVLGGLAVAVTLQVLATHTAAMQTLFYTVALTPGEWALVVAVASSVLWADELRKLRLRRLHRGEE
jgi:magnesium-transporting ATPase (P-type)